MFKPDNHYSPELNTKNPKILFVLDFALEKHINQLRKLGEPYIEH